MLRQKKWGPALLPGPTAPSEGSAGVRDLDLSARRPKNPSSILAHQLRRRFPSRRSKDPVCCWVWLPKEPLPPIPLRSARRLCDLDVPRPFLGWVPSTQPCLPGGETALVQGSTSSSGASCRLVRNSLRCVIVPKDSSASNFVPSPAGGDRYFGHSPHRLAVAGLLVRRGLPSRSQLERAQ